MDNNKLEVAQQHINNITIRIERLKKEISTETKDIAKYLEQDNLYWLSNSAKRMKELCDEVESLRKMQKEMQELFNFMKGE